MNDPNTDSAHRLRLAREAAGFDSAIAACERFGWKYPTYSGHENGNRGIRTEMLRAYAKAFKVDPAWLLTGSGPGPNRDTSFAPAPEPESPFGFAEAEAIPFQGAPGSDIARILELLRPADGPALTFEAQRDYAHLSILRGDLLVVGAPEQHSRGTVCVVNLVDTQTATGNTVIRQIFDGRVLPLPFSDLPNDANLDVGIFGTVVAVIRAPKLRSTVKG